MSICSDTLSTLCSLDDQILMFSCIVCICVQSVPDRLKSNFLFLSVANSAYCTFRENFAFVFGVNYRKGKGFSRLHVSAVKALRSFWRPCTCGLIAIVKSNLVKAGFCGFSLYSLRDGSIQIQFPVAPVCDLQSNGVYSPVFGVSAGDILFLQGIGISLSGIFQVIYYSREDHCASCVFHCCFQIRSAGAGFQYKAEISAFICCRCFAVDSLFCLYCKLVRSFINIDKGCSAICIFRFSSQRSVSVIRDFYLNFVGFICHLHAWRSISPIFRDRISISISGIFQCIVHRSKGDLFGRSFCSSCDRACRNCVIVLIFHCKGELFVRCHITAGKSLGSGRCPAS